MVNSVQTIVLMCSIILTTYGKYSRFDYDDYITQHDKEVVEYWLSGVRGTWYGYYNGFYHNKQKMDPNCLSREAEDAILEVMYFLAYGQLEDIFKVSDAIFSVYFDSLSYCGYKQSMNDIKRKCENDQEACTIGSLFKNAQSNFFSLLSSVNGFIELFLHHSAETADEFYSNAYDFGEGLGKLISAIYDI